MYKVYAYTCAQRTCAILHNYQGATRQSVIFVQIKSNAETHVYHKCVCIYASYIYAILYVFISNRYSPRNHPAEVDSCTD